MCVRARVFRCVCTAMCVCVCVLRVTNIRVSNSPTLTNTHQHTPTHANTRQHTPTLANTHQHSPTLTKVALPPFRNTHRGNTALFITRSNIAIVSSNEASHSRECSPSRDLVLPLTTHVINANPTNEDTLMSHNAVGYLAAEPHQPHHPLAYEVVL